MSGVVSILIGQALILMLKTHYGLLIDVFFMNPVPDVPCRVVDVGVSLREWEDGAWLKIVTEPST